MCFIKLDQIKSSQPIRDSNIYIAKGSPKSIPSLWVHHGRLLVGKLKYVLALDQFVAGWMGSSSRRPQTDGLGDLWNRATQMMVEISFVASRLYSMCSFSPRTTNSETCVCKHLLGANVGGTALLCCIRSVEEGHFAPQGWKKQKYTMDCCWCWKDWSWFVVCLPAFLWDLGGPSVGRADITRTEVNLCLSHLWRGNFAAPHESRLVTHWRGRFNVACDILWDNSKLCMWWL